MSELIDEKSDEIEEFLYDIQSHFNVLYYALKYFEFEEVKADVISIAEVAEGIYKKLKNIGKFF